MFDVITASARTRTDINLNGLNYRCVQNKCNILQDEDQDHLKHEHIEVHVHDVNDACEHADDVSLHAKRTESAVS